jgi:hypothetical protein
MPVHHTVYQDKHVFHLKFVDPWSMDELLRLNRIASDYKSTVHYKVHAIIDATGIKRLPNDIFQAHTAPNFRHPNSGALLLIGANTLVRTITVLVHKLASGEGTYFFETEAEAWVQLEAILAAEELPSR